MSSSSTGTALGFVGSIGVNIHAEYTDGKYANTSNVIADLRYLGLTHVRDAVLNSSNQGQANYDTLASAGIKFDLFFQGNALAKTFSLVDSFSSRHPGAISAIEGPNEVNNFGITYNGRSGNTAAVAYQADLYAMSHADPQLAGVPVYNLTSYPDLAGASDLANFHTYPKNGAEPFSQQSHDLSSQLAKNPASGIVLTEAGYTTLTSANYFGGVDEATQGKLLLNLLMDSTRLHVQQTYIYELLDAYADPNGSDPNKHFGLFHLDNTPKIAATDIHNLTTILSTGAQSGAFSAEPLSYSMTNLPTSAASFILDKSATVHDLIVWNEPTVWDGSSRTAVAAGTTPVEIHLDAASNVLVYDPTVGSSALRVLHNAHDLSFGVADHPLILEIQSSGGSGQLASAAGQAYSSSDATFSASGVLVSRTLQTDAGVVVETDAYNADGSYVAHVPVTGGGGTDVTFDAAGLQIGVVHYDAQGQVVAPPAAYEAASSGQQFSGTESADALNGGTGDDFMMLFGGNDTVHAGSGADTVFGNMGDDRIFGEDGSDYVWGGKGNDYIDGGAGSNWLFGNMGADTLVAGAGADSLWGGQDNDVLIGGAGDNQLSGDLGDDVLTGGGGHDQFIFAPGGGHDVITDFVHGQDMVNLTAFLPGAHFETLSQTAQGVLMTADTGDTLLLSGVNLGDVAISGGWIL